jgi:hypothetical protein
MDPLSALGIAAAVAQFLQFAGSLVSGSQQVYAEGALADHVECEKATRRLESLAKEVQSSLNDLSGLGKLSNDAKALRVICVRCSKLSEDLISRLNELRVDGKHRRWNSFRQALKSVCTQDKIEDIAAKLASCKDELNSHLIASIKYVTHLIFEVALEHLAIFSAMLNFEQAKGRYFDPQTRRNDESNSK